MSEWQKWHIQGAGLDARPSYLLYFVLCLEAEADMEHSRGTAAEPDAAGEQMGLATQDQCSLEALLHKAAGVSE